MCQELPQTDRHSYARQSKGTEAVSRVLTFVALGIRTGPPNMQGQRVSARSLLARLACLATALAITQTLFIQYCDFLFDCGCQPLWADRADRCNIHSPVPPHCPWCLDGGASGRWANVAIVVAQVLLSLVPGSFGAFRAASVFLAFPIVGGLGGLVAALLSGYWP